MNNNLFLRRSIIFGFILGNILILTRNYIFGYKILIVIVILSFFFFVYVLIKIKKKLFFFKEEFKVKKEVISEEKIYLGRFFLEYENKIKTFGFITLITLLLFVLTNSILLIPNYFELTKPLEFLLYFILGINTVMASIWIISFTKIISKIITDPQIDEDDV